jgi:hypothetical protein
MRKFLGSTTTRVVLFAGFALLATACLPASAATCTWWPSRIRLERPAHLERGVRRGRR